MGAAGSVADEKPTSVSQWWYIGGGVLLLGILLFILLRKKKKQPSVPPPPPLTLQEQCLNKLAEIESRKYWQQDEVKLYYTEVTEVVRLYITKQFKISAFELTSHQLLHQLKTGGISENIYLPLKQLFSLADMAKFAKVKPDAIDNESAIQIARNFIIQTTPVQTNDQPLA